MEKYRKLDLLNYSYLQDINKIIIGMDLTQSRLSSITQQSNQVEQHIKTQQALLKIYYELFAISLIKKQDEPKSVFQAISSKVQEKYPSQINLVNFFNDEENNSKTKYQIQYIKNLQKKSQSPRKVRVLTQQELQRKLYAKIEGSQDMAKVIVSPDKQQQFVQTISGHKVQKQLQSTAQPKLSLSDLLQHIAQLDNSRTQIKFQIYSEQSHRTDSLYKKWAQLHKKMKQLLEIYANKVGNGKTLLEIYNRMDKLKNSSHKIEGYSQKELFSKLDIYLQSLFLDQREILLYRSASERSRSVISGSSGYDKNRGLRKKLYYGP